MKRTYVMLLSTTLLFSLLFYEQRAGVNVFLFNLVLLFILGAADRTRLKRADWLIPAVASFVTSFFVLWHGTVIAVTSNIVSLSWLACVSLLPRSSFFPSMVFAFYSYISSFINVIIDFSERQSLRQQTNTSGEPKQRLDAGARIIFLIIGIAVVLVFVFLYSRANPVFGEFIRNINLDFLSMRWFAFTLLGFLLLYGFFKIRFAKNWSEKDRHRATTLNRDMFPGEFNMFLGYRMDPRTEGALVAVLLAALNIILLMLNVIDISFLAGGGELPTDVTYSDYVHRGVGTLIVSVVFVILMVMYFFRGALNFYEKAGLVRTLAFIWLAQNLIMLGSTAFRNSIYIEEYSLTYRRIGVYVWLALTAFGLLTTIVKVNAKKSSLFLIRVNGWSFFTAIVLLGSVNWDILISRYNTRNHDDADYRYLMNLNDNTLPVVYEALQQTKPDRFFEMGDDYHFNEYELEDIIDIVDYRIYRFNKDFEEKDWRSWNIDDETTYRQLP